MNHRQIKHSDDHLFGVKNKLLHLLTSVNTTNGAGQQTGMLSCKDLKNGARHEACVWGGGNTGSKGGGNDGGSVFV